jgi:AcrR family transcriptional regulator
VDSQAHPRYQGTVAKVRIDTRHRAGLVPRRVPTQERGQRTVDQLLGTAAVLLEEVGIDGFNTNLLAERAGVRVRTVYRYFPNKLAVITSVAERMVQEWDRWFEGFAVLADPRRDWRPLWDQYIDTFIAGARAQPGGVAIRRAMRALPELHAIDQEDNERLARQLARAVAQRGVGIPPARLMTVARTLIETAVAVIDLVLTAPAPRAAALAAELKRMHTAYGEQLFDEGRAGARPGRSARTSAPARPGRAPRR